MAMSEETTVGARPFMPEVGETPILLTGQTPKRERYGTAFASTFRHDRPLYVGALYTRDGHLIELSQRRPSPKRGVRPVDPPELPFPCSARRVEGRGCYLGPLLNHYGHFVTEGLSALWPDDIADFDYYAFHRFIFGYRPAKAPRACFARLGLDIRKVIVIDSEPLVFDDITVVECGWVQGRAVFASSREIYARIAAPFRQAPTRCFYLSRRHQERRPLANEADVEQVFAADGFEVIYPETLTFEEQLALFGQARIVAGPAGSALHNLLFCRPGTPLICLGETGWRNQMLCAKLMKSPLTLVPPDGNGADIEAVRTALRRT
jgi:hypothetical protein